MAINNIRVPDIGVDEVEVTELLVKVGEEVKEEQSLITVEGDKASIDIPSPLRGIINAIRVKVGDKISTGSLIMEIEDAISNKLLTQQQSEVSFLEKKNNDQLIKNIENKWYDVYATPMVRRLARKLNIDLTRIKGTGRKNRILREDIQNYIDKIFQSTKIAPQVNFTEEHFPEDSLSQPKIDFGKFGEIEKIKLSRIQKISGNNLSRNWKTIPHVTHFDKADITELEVFRKQQNIQAAKFQTNAKITLVVFVIKAVAAVLEKMPRFNSSLSEDGQFLILKKYINIGIAVDTSNGLLVPVIKDVNKKGILKLSNELIHIAKKARDGKLTASEMQGGCFTISSIGNLGTTHFIPIINAPEVAILGISKSVTESIWNGKEFVPRLMLPISLSFDHRVIDGADGARFITNISHILSDIRCLIM